MEDELVGGDQERERIPDGVRVSDIEFTEAGVFELDEGVRTLFVALPTIRSAHIAFGVTAERPVLGSIVGCALLATGLYFMQALLNPNLGDHPISRRSRHSLCRHSQYSSH